MWGGRIMNMNIHLSVRLWNDHVHYYNHIFIVCLFRPSLSYSVELLLYPLLWKSYPPSLPLRSLQIKRICTWSSPQNLLSLNQIQKKDIQIPYLLQLNQSTSPVKANRVCPFNHTRLLRRLSACNAFPMHTHPYIYIYICMPGESIQRVYLKWCG